MIYVGRTMIYVERETGLQILIHEREIRETVVSAEGRCKVIVAKELRTDAGQPCVYVLDTDEREIDVLVGTKLVRLYRISSEQTGRSE